MVRTRTRPAADRTTPNASVEDFISQLAERLNQSGKRTWKAKQVTTALTKSVQALPDSDYKTALEEDIEQHASQLLKLLQDAQSPPKTTEKPAKKSRKETAPAAATTTSLLFDDNVKRLVQQVVDGKYISENESLGLLFARVPATSQHIDALIDQQLGADDNTDGLIRALDIALKLCNAIAGQASTAAEALAVFGPAVDRLVAAADQEPTAKDLENYSNRLLFCMQTAASEVQLAAQRSNGRASRWLLQWQADDDDESPSSSSSSAAAEAACSRLVSVRVKIQMASNPLISHASLVKQATEDMRALQPYAATGQLLYNTAHDDEEAEIEDLIKSKDGIKSYLALYEAAVAQGVDDVARYMLCMLCARRASTLATAANQHTHAARILDTAASLQPPVQVMQWLQSQPPSAVVLTASTALRQGPSGLSAHLIREVNIDTLQALVAASRAGEAVDAANIGGVDELLFFESRQGDATAFGGDWGHSSDEEDGDDDIGLDMEDLPDAGKPKAASWDEDDLEEEFDDD